MGRKCCAAGCRSNYDNEKDYVTVFKFPPEQERRNLWIRSLKRQNFTPSSSAVVCIKHFEERFIIREDRVKRDDGSLLIVPRTKLALSSNAYPTIFENVPAYLTKKLPTERKHPDQRLQEQREREDQEFDQWCLNDQIQTFENFINICDSKVNDIWMKILKSEYVLFFKIQDLVLPKIVVSLKVHRDLTVQIWYENTEVDITTFKWLLGDNFKCDRWTKFENILNILSLYEENNLTFDQKISIAVQLLGKCFDDNECKDNENLNRKLKFLTQQLLLINVKRLRYSSDLILLCSKIYFSYPAAYMTIRDSKILTLPHPSYLKKLASLCIPAINSSSSYSSFLKNKSKLLKNEEKIVNVLLDEIYVNPSLTYKSGHLIGMSENSNSEASTIQAFMISSLLSKNKDVVALFPVRNLTTDILIKYTNDVLAVLHESGFTVVSLISDNNRINRNMFTAMCGGELKPFINNPHCSSKKLFFLFDSVHLVKAIRNNWINQAPPDQNIYFPNPYDSKISCASLIDLKNLHEIEKNSVLKLAPKLSQKVLCPNSIEKQNVRYALNLLHESNCSALEIFKERVGSGYLDTKIFIEYISQWWKIMNVKHPKKGEHINDVMANPIKTTEDINFIFLQKFSNWLNEWNKLNLLKADEKRKIGIPGKGGMLSRETFFALKFTTDSIIEIVRYAFESLGMSYILLGKFQTDSLEARFGQYRQMSGANYNISCLQVIESERKLKILSLLSLYSEKEGKFHLKDLNCLIQKDKFQDLEIPAFFYDVFNSYDDIEITDDNMSVLIYIAGYVAYKVTNKLSCRKCMSLLVRDKVLELECPEEIFKYLLLEDRGQLKWPQKILIHVMVHSFQIFQKLITQTYESTFVRHIEPKNLLIQLVIEKLEYIEINLDVKCSCGSTIFNLIKQCLSGIANIYLNNYTKIKNDKKSSSKRKLSTLINS